MVPEFEQQAFVAVAMPHEKTDWAPYIEEARTTFSQLIAAIARFEPCVVFCDEIVKTKRILEKNSVTANEKIILVEAIFNDTWVRDSLPLCVLENGRLVLKKFAFDGWGGKFENNLDDKLWQFLPIDFEKTPVETVSFVLEGGSVESNGKGSILTTSSCLLNTNRGARSYLECEMILKKQLNAKEILWLESGEIQGDDTDGHIDTIARFADAQTILYVQDDLDEHLHQMRLELEKLSFKLVSLPMPKICENDLRLGATYANFLLVNKAVLTPVYGVEEDKEALRTFEKVFPKRQVVGVDCLALLRQNGSLHCSTMNFAKGVVFKKA